MENPSLLIVWYAVFLFSIVLHEAAHAFASYRMGDPTAYAAGQVSLNPVPHIKREVWGTVLIPLISYFYSGWMIGWASAPFNVLWAQKNPKKSALMAMAGPASNLVLLLVAFFIIRMGFALDWFYAPDSINFSRITASNNGFIWNQLATMLSILFSLNLILFLFNLLPLPVLDGGNIPLFFLRGEQALKYQEFIHNPRFTLISILVAWYVFGYIYRPVHLFCINLLYPGVQYG